MLAATLGTAAAAQAQTHITTRPGPFHDQQSFAGTENGRPITGTSRPGPFAGYRETDVNRGGRVTRCTTRPAGAAGECILRLLLNCNLPNATP